jgi:regulator of RNase E activity RraA
VSTPAHPFCCSRRSFGPPPIEVSVYVPVVLQGVGVVPGQYVFADSSVAVLIPDGQIARDQVRVHDHLR